MPSLHLRLYEDVCNYFVILSEIFTCKLCSVIAQYELCSAHSSEIFSSKFFFIILPLMLLITEHSVHLENKSVPVKSQYFSLILSLKNRNL